MMKSHSSKYNAKKVVIDGIKFASQKEGKRYEYLKAEESAGTITGLALQTRYTLIPSQYEMGQIKANGELKKGKCLERAVEYISDFEYDVNGVHVVEDVKGMATPQYVIKRKLMLFFKNVKIREVKKWNEPVLR